MNQRIKYDIQKIPDEMFTFFRACAQPQYALKSSRFQGRHPVH